MTWVTRAAAVGKGQEDRGGRDNEWSGASTKRNVSLAGECPSEPR